MNSYPDNNSKKTPQESSGTTTAAAETISKAASPRISKWLVAGWLLTVIFAIIALQQAIVRTHEQNAAIVLRLQADAEKTRADQLQQQLEAERIIASREITSLRQQLAAPSEKPSEEKPPSQ